MGNDKVVSLAAPAVVEDALTELLRTGAQQLRGGVGGIPASAVDGEGVEAVAGWDCERGRDEDGREREQA